MSKFTETVKQETPRLVVMYGGDGKTEKFQWGIVGLIPILSLIGAIVRVQGELHFRAAEECDQSAFVIAWDASDQSFSWFVHPSIPLDPLVGMLDTVREALVGTHMARQAAAQQLILGPDGRPMRR